MPRSAASDLGLHCLHMPVSLSNLGINSKEIPEISGCLVKNNLSQIVFL